jgi:hypothetical protein
LYSLALVNWTEIQDELEHGVSDILLILNTCHAREAFNVSKQIITSSNRAEVLRACPASSVTLKSYPGRFIDGHIKEMSLKARSPVEFSVGELRSAVDQHTKASLRMATRLKRLRKDLSNHEFGQPVHFHLKQDPKCTGKPIILRTFIFNRGSSLAQNEVILRDHPSGWQRQHYRSSATGRSFFNAFRNARDARNSNMIFQSPKYSNPNTNFEIIKPSNSMASRIWEKHYPGEKVWWAQRDWFKLRLVARADPFNYNTSFMRSQREWLDNWDETDWSKMPEINFTKRLFHLKDQMCSTGTEKSAKRSISDIDLLLVTILGQTDSRMDESAYQRKLIRGKERFCMLS